MLQSVITGGQTGVDQAGWRAAKACGLETLGWMPKDFITEDGRRPEFASLYNARQKSTEDYPSRTRANLELADYGICLNAGPDFSPGTKLLNRILIEKAQAREAYPSLTFVGLEFVNDEFRVRNEAYEPEGMVEFIERFRCRRLLIAGNRESRAPGIGKWAESYFLEIFRLALSSRARRSEAGSR